MVTAEFMTLPFFQQKFTALTILPSALSQIAHSSDVMKIMAHIRLTPCKDICKYLQSADLIRQLDKAHTNQPPTQMDTTPTTTILLYHNRFKMRHTRWGDTWRGPGEVLRLWLKAVLPPIHADHYSLTLTRRPIEKSSDNITFHDSTPPSAEVLDHYTHGTKSEKGFLVQFEFWFSTSNSKMGSGRTRPSSLARTLPLSTPRP